MSELKLEAIESDVQSFLKKKYPSVFNQLEVSVATIHRPNVNDANVTNLVQAIFYVLLSNKIDSCSVMGLLVRQFAKEFKEFGKRKEVSDILAGKNTAKVPISICELIVARDMNMAGFKLTKGYNLKGELFSLGDLIDILQASKDKIFSIFDDIYTKYNINVPFQMQNFAQTSGTGALPQL